MVCVWCRSSHLDLGPIQRHGRGDRDNRKRDLHTHRATLNLPYELRRQEILEGKRPLTEALQEPSEDIDDTGLLRELRRQRELRLGAMEAAQRDSLTQAAG